MHVRLRFLFARKHLGRPPSKYFAKLPGKAEEDNKIIKIELHDDKQSLILTWGGEGCSSLFRRGSFSESDDV